MAIFTVNGKSTDDLNEALNLVNEAWHEAKAPAVMEQRRQALSKPTPLDLERAELGIEPDIDGKSSASARNARSGGSATVT